jgi:hypothetical protein
MASLKGRIAEEPIGTELPRISISFGYRLANGAQWDYTNPLL